MMPYRPIHRADPFGETLRSGAKHPEAQA